MKVNRSELGDIFGVSVNTVSAWVKRGCPVIRKGGSGTEYQFDTGDAFKWTRDDAQKSASGESDLQQERTRLTKLQADRAELDLAVQRGLFASIEDFKTVTRAKNANVRARVLMLGQLAPQLEMRKTAEIKGIIDEAVRICLTDLAERRYSGRQRGLDSA